MRTDRQADERTDRDVTKQIVVFRDFANEPTNSTFSPRSVFVCFALI
jgi:hypothetical protein